MVIRRAGIVSLVASFAFVSGAAVAGPQDNVTYHHDAMRTGWYSAETKINVATAPLLRRIATLVAPAGKPAFGKVYAQPLYVAAEPINGAPRDLVIIATSTAQLYAFDAQSLAMVWHKDFTDPANGVVQQTWGNTGCQDINPDLGIISTPVIDRRLDRLYVVVATDEKKSTPRYHMRIHAIALTTGADVHGVGPTEVMGSTTSGGETYSVSPLHNLSRAALLESGENVYVALASHCDQSTGITHGWLLSYSTTTLARTGNLLNVTNEKNTLDNGQSYFLGSPWMGGFGPAADASGFVYFATGNGPWNGTTNFAMTVLKVPPNLDITKVDYFTPASYKADSAADQDLGSGGVMLIPDQRTSHPRMLIQGGKESVDGQARKYILDRDNLGKHTPNNGGALAVQNLAGPMYGGPAYFEDANKSPYIVYGGGRSDFPTPLTTYTLTAGPPGLIKQSAATYSPLCLECRNAGSQPVVSSNGTQAGSAVVWALQTPNGSAGTIQLYAFEALKMGHTLVHQPVGPWNPAPSTSYVGGAMVSPLVANGRVYVPFQDGVAVFGQQPARNAVSATASAAPRPAVMDAANRAAALPSSVFGVISAINGMRLTLRTRDGTAVTVDATRAIEAGTYSGPLFVGKQVVAQGTKRPDGVLDAARVLRVTNYKQMRPPGR